MNGQSLDKVYKRHTPSIENRPTDQRPRMPWPGRFVKDICSDFAIGLTKSRMAARSSILPQPGNDQPIARISEQRKMPGSAHRLSPRLWHRIAGGTATGAANRKVPSRVFVGCER